MQIDAPVAREVQQPGRKNFAVRDDDNNVGAKRVEKLSRLIRFQGARLIDGKVKLARAFFHRRTLKRLATPARFVRLRDNSVDVVAFFEEAIKRGQRKIRASHERQRYSHLPWRISFLIRRLIMSRLMKLMWSRKNFPSR